MTPDLAPGLVVFDGVCVLCNGFARWVDRHDHRNQFRFATAQSPVGRDVYHGAGLSPDALDTILVRHQGKVLQKSDAVLAVMAGFGGLWTVLALARFVPRRVRDWVYDRVARNRYRWFGRLESCPLPAASLSRRFVDGGLS